MCEPIILYSQHYYSGGYATFISVDISVSVTPSGDSDNTAGQMYILNCIVSVSGSAVQPTIFWLGGGAETDFATDTARTVSMTSGSDGSYSSTLTFNPLAVSHAGTYICRATLGGAEVNGSTEVIIKGISMLRINDVIYKT